LFELARDSDALDAVAQDLTALSAMVDESGDFRRLIESPVLTREDQGRAVGAIAGRARLGDITTRFLGVLARQRRLFALPGCIAAYRSMLAEHKGEITAEVISAQPLSDDQLATVRSSIERTAGQGVNLDTSVDPALIGGVVVRLGSRMIDASLKTKLQHLEHSMRGIG
jgi:F-type H+-transporting ATPase subunit delta